MLGTRLYVDSGLSGLSGVGPFLRFSFPSRLSQAGISSLSLGGKVQVDTSSLLYLHELQCYITCYHIPDMHLLSVPPTSISSTHHI